MLLSVIKTTFVLSICTNSASAQAGSGSLCDSSACMNGGSCDVNGDCLCPPEWFGQYCEMQVSAADSETPSTTPAAPVRTIFDDLASNTRYILVAEGENFGVASGKCIARGSALLVSDTHDLSVYNALQRLFAKGQSAGTVQVNQQWYWALHHKYPVLLPHISNSTCPAISRSNDSKFLPCSTAKLPYICQRPINGSCHPFVKEASCPDVNSVCLLNTTDGGCQCREGYKEEPKGNKCVDKDECSRNNVCSGIRVICRNTIGSYICGCPAGMQGNGINVCGYVVTMVQQFNFTALKSATAHMPMGALTAKMALNEETAFKALLEDKLLQVYRLISMSVEKIFVKEIHPDNATVIYDVYSKDQYVSPTSLLEFYREAERRNELYYLQGYYPSAAQPVCSSSILGLGRKIFNFTSTVPGFAAPSLQRCGNARQKATVECKTKTNSDGTVTAFYDYRTLTAVPCDVTLNSIKVQISKTNNTREFEEIARQLTSLTADYENPNQEIFHDAATSLNALAAVVWKRKAEITQETMTCMIAVADNINKAQKYDRINNKSNQFDARLRFDIARSLKWCSLHTEIDSTAGYSVTSEFITVQVTNAVQNNMGAESGTRNGVSFASQVAHPAYSDQVCQTVATQTVLSFIPEEAVNLAEEAKTKQTDDLTTLPVSFIYFTDAEFFTFEEKNYTVEQVLSAQISNVKVENLMEPVWFQMPQSKRAQTNKKEVRFYRCAALDEASGRWISDGCVTLPGSEPPNCTCNHMTNFAVIVQTHTFLKEYSLEIFGQICCALSILGLFLMLFIHLYFPSLRGSVVVQIHTHLGFCLFVAYIVLLSSVERPRFHGSCVAVAATLQFFLLSAWGWMIVECVTMYQKLVVVFTQIGSRYVLKSSALVYVSSACVVAVTLIVAVAWYDANFNGWVAPAINSETIPSSYISDRLCWLHGYSLIFGFLLPVGIALIINFVGFFLILRSITWGQKNITSIKAKQSNDIRAYLHRTVVVSILLGLSWAFAIPLTLSDDPYVNLVFGWLFSIANGLQGLFMFLLFCVKRKDVRELWMNALKEVFREGTQEEPNLSESNRGTRDVMSSTASQSNAGQSNVTAITNVHVLQSVEENERSGRTVNSRDEMVDIYRMGTISSFNPNGRKKKSV